MRNLFSRPRALATIAGVAALTNWMQEFEASHG